MTIKVQVITQKDIDDALRAVVRARIQLLIYQPFFGSLAMSLDPVCRPEVQTMATDGRKLYYAPQFVLQKKEKEMVAVLAHEVMHVANMHMTRRGLRDPMTWNVAADYAINGVIAEACQFSQASMELPKEALIDKKYLNKSAEWIYDDLERSGKGRGKGGSSQPGGPDPGGMGGVIDAIDAHGNPLSEADRNVLEQDVKVAVFQAAMSAKNKGNLPACLDRLVGEMRKPIVDWKERLRRFWSAQFPSDYSLSRPNRRGVHAGLYLPSEVKDGTGEIAVAIDTSGSVGQAELAQFIGEINAIADETMPEKLHVMSCDAKVHTYQVFEPGEIVDHTTIRTGGGGGTSFVPPFRMLAKKQVEPKCLVYLTDLCGDFPEDPGYPVLWISTTELVAPFGDTVQIRVTT